MVQRKSTGDIRGFYGDHFWLSNFAVESDGKTVEHRFQAEKAVTDRDYDRVLAAATPNEAKALGRKIALRDDWEEVKLDVMLDLLREKFADNPLRWMLTATAGRELVEANYWGDTYWGVNERTGRGENHLGRLLMQVRDELIAEDAKAG